ncbi:MAG: protocatechuate 3,4-dioxygenase [Bryobacteraceae bacterium]
MNQFDRRTLLKSAALLWTPGLMAEELTRTPRQTEGPFYPDRLPLDKDNDLIVINDSLTPAVGEITHVHGRVLTTAGSPIRGIAVEIWQVDNNAAYIHSRSQNRDRRDTNFQGFGRFETGSTGEYRFRTIKPVPYPGRTPHIHFALKKGGVRMLTTQLYIKGHPQNRNDGVIRFVGDPKLLELLMADFVPVKDSKTGELTARFDIVLGGTPEDPKSDPFRGRGGRPPRPPV